MTQEERDELQPYLRVNVSNVDEVADNIGHVISSLGSLVAQLEEQYSLAKLNREVTVAEISEECIRDVTKITGKRPTEKQIEIVCLTSELVKEAYAREFATKRKWREAQNLLSDYYSTASMVPALLGRVTANARLEMM